MEEFNTEIRKYVEDLKEVLLLGPIFKDNDKKIINLVIENLEMEFFEFTKERALLIRNSIVLLELLNVSDIWINKLEDIYKKVNSLLNRVNYRR